MYYEVDMNNTNGLLSVKCEKCGTTILMPKTPEMPGITNYYYGYCYDCWMFMHEFDRMEAKRNFLQKY